MDDPVMASARRIILGTLVGLFLLVLLAFGIHTASAQAAGPPRVTLPTQLTGMDRMTYVMTTAERHPLCWANGNTQTNLAIRFYRYRVEGGAKALYVTLPIDLWSRVPGDPGVGSLGNFCTAGTHSVPKAGHWVYEAEICFTPIAGDGSNCSERVSAACAAGTAGCAGAVADTPRGWWVYAYLPAPVISPN